MKMTLSNSPNSSYDFDLKDFITSNDISDIMHGLKGGKIKLKYFEDKKGVYYFNISLDKNGILIGTDGSKFSLQTLDLVYRTFSKNYKLPRYLDGKTGLQLNDKLFSNTIHLANQNGLTDTNLAFILRVLIGFSKFYNSNFQ